MSNTNVALHQPTDEPGMPEEDHRIRVGRERRGRMRGHLLQSVLQVCSAERGREVATIDDVVHHAKVSRGTFYKYFISMDQATSELGLQLADEMTTSVMSVYGVIEDPVLRTATGFQLFLIRAMIEPDWGTFIADIRLLAGDNLFTHNIRQDILLGIQTGDYAVPSVEVASDLLMGAKIEAIRRLIEGRGMEYAKAMTVMVLRSFGVGPSKADKSVAIAYERLSIEAPGKIAWWQAPAEHHTRYVAPSGGLPDVPSSTGGKASNK